MSGHEHAQLSGVQPASASPLSTVSVLHALPCALLCTTLQRVTPNGTAIRALRQALNLGLRDLESLTGLNRGYLSRLERGQAGSGRNAEVRLRKIATAMSVPVAAINREERQ